MAARLAHRALAAHRALVAHLARGGQRAEVSPGSCAPRLAAAERGLGSAAAEAEAAVAGGSAEAGLAAAGEDAVGVGGGRRGRVEGWRREGGAAGVGWRN